jgi:hypothetical protein
MTFANMPPSITAALNTLYEKRSRLASALTATPLRGHDGAAEGAGCDVAQVDNSGEDVGGAG